MTNLHYITLHYITLHYITLHYITLFTLFRFEAVYRPFFAWAKRPPHEPHSHGARAWCKLVSQSATIVAQQSLRNAQRLEIGRHELEETDSGSDD